MRAKNSPNCPTLCRHPNQIRLQTVNYLSHVQEIPGLRTVQLFNDFDSNQESHSSRHKIIQWKGYTSAQQKRSSLSLFQPALPLQTVRTFQKTFFLRVTKPEIWHRRFPWAFLLSYTSQQGRLAGRKECRRRTLNLLNRSKLGRRFPISELELAFLVGAEVGRMRHVCFDRGVLARAPFTMEKRPLELHIFPTIHPATPRKRTEQPPPQSPNLPFRYLKLEYPQRPTEYLLWINGIMVRATKPLFQVHPVYSYHWERRFGRD